MKRGKVGGGKRRDWRDHKENTGEEEERRRRDGGHESLHYLLIDTYMYSDKKNSGQNLQY